MPLRQKIDQFLSTAIGSSGKLTSHIVLMEKAILLIKSMRENDEAKAENCRRVRNILAQLQMALNYREGTSADSLFTLYDYLYDEITIGDDMALNSAETLLDQLKNTLLEINRKKFK